MTADYLEISNGTLRARLLPQGAALNALWHSAVPRSLVLGWVDGAKGGYMGALVGPVANRIGGAAVTIDGTRWQIQPNEGVNCLHSGDQGIHTRIWKVTEHSKDSVTFALTLLHGDCGLPGRRVITARYALEHAALRLDICATTDRTTLVNIAHHPYWNLAGQGDVRGHHLLVHADSYLPVGPDKLPTGAQASVADLGLVARTSTPLIDAAALDHNLCLAPARSDALRPAARLTGPNSMQLSIATTEPGLQVYDGAGLRDTQNSANTGARTGPYAGIALEPQGWPDAPHHDGFPSIALRSGDNYRQTTLYTLELLQIP
ncbi:MULTISPECIES: aldose epimerase family protein [Roseobacteraceae]|jgi:aldose 1-epimerase|nr:MULTISPECIES: aldose epimerase family protein [Roseobacteraceae]